MISVLISLMGRNLVSAEDMAGSTAAILQEIVNEQGCDPKRQTGEAIHALATELSKEENGRMVPHRKDDLLVAHAARLWINRDCCHSSRLQDCLCS